ncbi:MAG: hypothetical protein A2070_03795 [Bdellovibrionales bacterium GWC1_52_8]|nr:MAG: hypothetical protein A2X97_10085 [Bdellovibrionales bacterium GWA1_52_35]OFZ40674.1 MAG: hypothetical protein A2070_03795 [Bdellovibrionales bacterium GWC1_52_8]HCM40551.1 hypothetical protein [Bdellovibrionales bacterium]
MLLTLLTAVFATGCTGQIPNSFRLRQQEEAFSSQLQINTKIDLLWVVDNSSSMDVSQEKLRQGFRGFAEKYMKPTWDIRIAVITTDTYLADYRFNSYLETVVPGTADFNPDTGSYWQSSYMASKNRAVWNPLYNPVTQAFDNPSSSYIGVKIRDMVPVWDTSYAKLQAGNHDGPIPGLCFEGLPYFLFGVTECAIRDDQARFGVASCLTPGADQSSISECVNTVENNTVRSGKPILSTTPAADYTGTKEAWTEQLIADFLVNMTTGSVGHGSERGLSSVLQLLTDNESGDTRFFRKGALRGIIFVSDEDDQSMVIPEIPAPGFSPYTDYTTACAAKDIEGASHTVASCPLTDSLIPVENVKSQIDEFFTALDETAVEEAAKSYFVASIVPKTMEVINALQASRDLDDIAVGAPLKKAVDRGDRYIQLGTLVGNGSVALDIAGDYSQVLDVIGRAIIENKSTFTLERAPTGTEDMIVKVLHEDGTTTIIPSDKYVVSGKQLIITDQDLVLGFSSTDQVLINYQPKTLY